MANIGIIGLGMMGGSLALALQGVRSGASGGGVNAYARADVGVIAGADCCADGGGGYKIYAFDAEQEVIDYAKQKHIIQEGFTGDYDAFFKAIDIAIICSPLSSYPVIFQQFYKWQKANIAKKLILSDVGSVKFTPILQAKKYLKEFIHQFVPAHPIAGIENSGIYYADENLYQGKLLLITPHKPSDSKDNDLDDVLGNRLGKNLGDDAGVKMGAKVCVKAESLIESIWNHAGSHVKYIEPQKHDAIYAKTSHMVQILCNIYASMLIKNWQNEIGEVGEAGTAAKVVKVGKDGEADRACEAVIGQNEMSQKALQKMLQHNENLRKFLRLTGSNAKMWADITFANQGNIKNLLQSFINFLDLPAEEFIDKIEQATMVRSQLITKYEYDKSLEAGDDDGNDDDGGDNKRDGGNRENIAGQLEQENCQSEHSLFNNLPNPLFYYLPIVIAAGILNNLHPSEYKYARGAGLIGITKIIEDFDRTLIRASFAKHLNQKLQKEVAILLEIINQNSCETGIDMVNNIGNYEIKSEGGDNFASNLYDLLDDLLNYLHQSAEVYEILNKVNN